MLCKSGIVFGGVTLCVCLYIWVYAVTQVKPPAVDLPPALLSDRCFFSSVTRSDSKCYTEALHIARHDALFSANVLSSFESILHAFRLCFSMSLYFFHCPPRERVPCLSWLQKACFGWQWSCADIRKASDLQDFSIRYMVLPLDMGNSPWPAICRVAGSVLHYHHHHHHVWVPCLGMPSTQKTQDAQLSQRDHAAGCVIVFAKSRRLELGDNILRTL